MFPALKSLLILALLTWTIEITTEKGSNFQKSKVWFNIAPPQDFTERVKLHLVVNPNNMRS